MQQVLAGKVIFYLLRFRVITNSVGFHERMEHLAPGFLFPANTAKATLLPAVL